MYDKISLIENSKILSINEEISECFNDYFTNITDSLDIDLSSILYTIRSSMNNSH